MAEITVKFVLKFQNEPEMPHISIEMINETIHKIVKRISLSKPHTIDFEKLSVRERMSYLIEKYILENLYFKDLFDDVPSIQLLVVTLLALLQLFKEQVIYISQTDPYSDIYVNKKMKMNKAERANTILAVLMCLVSLCILKIYHSFEPQISYDEVKTYSSK